MARSIIVFLPSYFYMYDFFDNYQYISQCNFTIDLCISTPMLTIDQEQCLIDMCIGKGKSQSSKTKGKIMITPLK
jgi:hypothetical protein